MKHKSFYRLLVSFQYRRYNEMHSAGGAEEQIQ